MRRSGYSIIDTVPMLAIIGILAGILAGVGIGIVTGRAPSSSSSTTTTAH
ncbi:MAG TPA: hypothetical protein VMH04_03525 [Candidatus Solibacter sp.]|jgi:hypothetical protein|nr:hypothetical protein [Candidatus Solibacter sp.]